MAKVEAVFLDVGETLVSEESIYNGWADWLGVPRHTFLAKLGGVIASGGRLRDLFEHFRPGFDLAAEEERRAAAGVPNAFGPDDLYPDARSCLAELRAAGLLVGIAGNQPAAAAARLAAMDLPADVIGISALWGVEKPAPEFFARCAAEAGVPAERVLYVGDRVDNDIGPALAAGMRAAFLRRGPWGHIQTLDGLPRDLDLLAELADLAALPALVTRLNAP